MNISKDRIRNWLNIVFMIMAVVGVILFLSKNEERHNMGLYIIMVAMCIKIAESSLRMMMLIIAFQFTVITSFAQDYNQIDEMGNVTQRNENQNFNKHNNDTTRNKEIPKGFYTWTVDRTTGDRIFVEPDTLSHLFMNTTFNNGVYGEYNHTGSNYTPRLSRIFFNRPESDDFIFTQPYSFVEKRPEDHLFMNTLSPYTSVLYDNCGDKTNGEDHFDAKFAVNAGKQINVGFDLDYAYARGYFSDQSLSHFNGTVFGSYIGDRYNLHLFFNASHQKASENGGITNDNYVTHPESFQDNYAENEIPTQLTRNWNRNDHQHLFLTHRYNFGFYRKVKMTEAELKAREFAQASKKEKEAKEAAKKDQDQNGPGKRKENAKPSGRPEGAKIMGAQPKADSLSIAADTTRIKVDGQAAIDSLNREQAIQDSIDATMKREYVPVTSIFHTLEWNNNRHIYQAYNTPSGYYRDTYYSRNEEVGNDSIFDIARHRQFKNTFGLALLEGFNKYVKAGLKAFISYDYNNYELPDTLNGIGMQTSWHEHTVSIGAQLSKTQGRTLHFDLRAESWIAGVDAGDLLVDFNTDLNFRLLGDTVRLAANAYFHRITPPFFQYLFRSKHIWWENDLSAETRSRIEGVFSYEKTKTKLRVGIEEIQNYTYYGMSYDLDPSTYKLTNMTAGVYQESGNINIMTAQLQQDFRLGPLNWENVITYQNSSNTDALPLPTWNIFTNLYLKFRIAKVLDLELGADAIFFSKYYAPDYCPMITQFAVQKNEESRVELGGYPFIDVYANFRLKGVRFFIMMSHVNSGSGNAMSFLAPHYPTNSNVLHFGVSWPFFN